jgi:predicted acyl esterase
VLTRLAVQEVTSASPHAKWVDRPRPNASPGLAYTMSRIGGAIRPNVEVFQAPTSVRVDRDVAVPMRDGALLRCNVFLPAERENGAVPAIVCAHPYGKDAFPRKTPLGFAPPLQYRVMRQAGRARFSSLATWESPDPAFWTAHGYALVNADLRGFGKSEGSGALLSDHEAQDYYDLVEWVAAQSWCNGRIGLNGVSYLALSQWKTAALQPPHLQAICPWEGFSDLYSDFARPGGIREDGFLPFWSAAVRRGGRTTENLREEQCARPLRDAWWQSKAPHLEAIEVPALICASFSDQGLHSRGSFAAFERIASKHRWLYTHRGGKWATYYSPDALAMQLRFFDTFLKDAENGMRELPPVRLEIRKDRDTISAVRWERTWPLERTAWTPLYLQTDGRLTAQSGAGTAGVVRFGAGRGTASFAFAAARDLEVAGPMSVQLRVGVEGADDASLFCYVRKIDARGRNVPFEGAYGYGFDVVSKGWLKLSMRKVDAGASQPWRPVLSFDEAQPLASGEVVDVSIELLPSATFFAAGEGLQLDVCAHWLVARHDPVLRTPQFYQRGPESTIVLHCGGSTGAHLLVPVLQSP